MLHSTSFPLPSADLSPARELQNSPDSLHHAMQRVKDAWTACQSMRARGAIYLYLSAVFDLVTWWRAQGDMREQAQQALQLAGLAPFRREHPFAAVIRCTADAKKVEKRTRSKWSRVLRYAAKFKPGEEPLQAFIERKGGINKCAGKYTRWKRSMQRVSVRAQ